MEPMIWGMGMVTDQHGIPASGPASQPVTMQPTGKARLVIAGVGGGGTNAVNRMIAAELRGVDYVAINTDAQALDQSHASVKLQIGTTTTRGLGAGGNPAVGAKAAEESYVAIREALAGADLVFITAGMGGGTGTGASALVAQAARELGALTVGIVTTPFGFERRRMAIAEQGVLALRNGLDALIVVPNERLMQLAAHETGVFEAYRLADDVLRMGVQGISDLIAIPGLINLDFADIRSVLADAGSAYMAIAQSSGENRAEAVARAALTNPLLDANINGARGLIFNVTGGDDLAMHEVGRIAELLGQAAHPDANIIFGTVYDPAADGTLKLTVVATGFEQPLPQGQLGQPWISAHVAATPAGDPAGVPVPTTARAERMGSFRGNSAAAARAGAAGLLAPDAFAPPAQLRGAGDGTDDGTRLATEVPISMDRWRGHNRTAAAYAERDTAAGAALAADPDAAPPRTHRLAPAAAPEEYEDEAYEARYYEDERAGEDDDAPDMQAEPRSLLRRLFARH